MALSYFLVVYEASLLNNLSKPRITSVRYTVLRYLDKNY